MAQNLSNDSSLEERIQNALSNIFEETIESVVINTPEELVSALGALGLFAQVHFNGSATPKNIFVKRFGPSLAHTNYIKELKLMDKESNFYIQFLQQASKFCRKNQQGKLLDFFPRIYYGDNEMIILENLVLDKGFQIPNPIGQDLETARLVVLNLAKFHAVSYAMLKDGGVEQFASHTWDLLTLDYMQRKKNQLMDAIFSNGPLNCIQILKASVRDESESAIKYLQELADGALDRLYEIIEKALTSPFAAVSHGDFWFSNIMNKINPESKKVEQSIFVDFQCTRFGSVNMDLGYYLFSSVRQDVRENHLEEFLRIYFDEFQNTLKLLNSNCNFPFEDFKVDFKDFVTFGFLFKLTMMTTGGAKKEMDFDKVYVMDEAAAGQAFNAAIRAWISKNPEASEALAAEIILLVQEFKAILGNGI